MRVVDRVSVGIKLILLIVDRLLSDPLNDADASTASLVP